MKWDTRRIIANIFHCTFATSEILYFIYPFVIDQSETRNFVALIRSLRIITLHNGWRESGPCYITSSLCNLAFKFRIFFPGGEWRAFPNYQKIWAEMRATRAARLCRTENTGRILDWTGLGERGEGSGSTAHWSFVLGKLNYFPKARRCLDYEYVATSNCYLFNKPFLVSGNQRIFS